MDSREEWSVPSVPETRKLIQVTGKAPPSAILLDAQARKEINVRRGPPKGISKHLVKEFISGRKNPAQCLNEACQCENWSLKYIETTPSKPYDQYGRFVFAITAIVDGQEYQPGEAKTKKEAKAEASRNALIDILMLNDDDMHGRGPGYQCDTYGRAIPVERSSAMSQNTDKSFDPLPAPVASHKSNFLPAPSGTVITDDFGKMRIAPRIFDSVGALAEKKLRKLFKSHPVPAQSCLQGTVAMFIVKKASYGEVVALGSGDSCFRMPERPDGGNVLLDCHAETVARRAFRRYLIQQIKMWYKGDDASREHCIFERPPDSEKLCIKHTVTVHLYLSKPPKGLARSPLPDPATSAGQFRNDFSLVSLHNGGDNEERLSSKNMQPTSPVIPMACMSGSDKIMKWTVCGVQGSVLSNFVTPIYLNSITLESDDGDGNPNKCAPLILAVTQRIDPEITTRLPGVFIVDQISKIDSYVKNFSPPGGARPLREQLSVNWTIGDDNLEVVDAYSGMVDATSQVEGPYSRLSKAAFFHSCIKLAPYTDRTFRNNNYISAKKSDQDYNKTKVILLSYLKNQGFGHWLERPTQVNLFKP